MLVVTENSDRGVVIVEGREIEGFIDEEICVSCCQFRVYYDDFDAFFCPQCNNWLESACNDSGCEYCSNRPVKPLGLDANTKI